MNEILKNTCILTAITLISGAGLGAVYSMTKEPIAARAKQIEDETCKRVLPEAESFEELEYSEIAGAKADIIKVYSGVRTGGEAAGRVYLIREHEGYGGDIEIAVGVDAVGVCQGVDILDISETPGLGMRAKEAEFLGQFAGREAEAFSFSASGDGDAAVVDAISGATITTNAMVNGVNTALEFDGKLNTITDSATE